MSTNFKKREKITNKISIIKNGVVKNVEIKDFLKKNQIDWIIRIQKDDFSDLKKTTKYLRHFNLQCSHHKAGKIYGLVEIFQSGYYKDDEDCKDPILSSDCIFLAKCTGVKSV